MNYLKLSVIAGVIIAAIVLGHGMAHATTTNTCTPVQVANVATASPAAGEVAYSFNVAGQGQTATAQVKAGSSCNEAQVSLVSYQSPSQDGQPLTSQTMYDSQSKSISTEVTSFGIQVPNCFYQVDLVYGQPLDLSTGQTYSNQNRLIAYANDGSNTCQPGVGGGGGTTPIPITPSVSTTVTTLPETGSSYLSLLLSTLGAAVAYKLSKRQVA